ncbi:MAG: transcription termination/antitermination protein NusA [Candidatus Brocadiia bacterium]|nr:MAG: transcription termination/antitermination protein NusA [Candidatus Brocadiia bacterium]
MLLFVMGNERTMNQELLRIVENIAREKSIDKESIFVDLEEAMVSAARKHFSEPETDFVVRIDRQSGEISAFKNLEMIDIKKLGRIPAQTAKQVMMQKIRADERESIYSEFTQRRGEIISGTVVRFDSGNLVIDLNHRTEGFMPKSEQIMGQTHKPGERIRCLILEVKEASGQVKIILSRTHPDFIKKLFELEVPEISEDVIEIQAIAREAGYRTKVAVVSHDDKVDPVGACVGVRGSRIKNIVDELGGEKIDIVRWSDSSQVLITNALMPAKATEIALCFESGRATVVVEDDQLSLAIGKHGQNVRLAARLTGWDVDILTPKEYNQGIELLAECVKRIDVSDDTLVDKLIALGVISIIDLEDVGVEPLVKELNIPRELAEKIIRSAGDESRKLAARSKQNQAENYMKKETGKAKIKNTGGDTVLP